MKKKTEYKINENGSFSKKETIITTPEDGFVPEREIRPAALSSETRGKSRKGYSTSKAYTTNDPRVTRPFIYIFCGIFFLIGMITLLLHLWFFAAAFIGAAIFIFVKSNKDVDAIAEKLKKQGKDVTIDSAEEWSEVMSDAVGQMKDGMKEVGQETFQKDHVKSFAKKSLPIYCILSLAASIGMGVGIHKALGMLVFVVLAVGGALYYGIVLLVLPRIFGNK